MKKIKNLTVEVKYRVSLCDIEVSEKIHEALTSCENEELSSEYFHSPIRATALEWLQDNIEERDAIEWSFEIQQIE